MDYQRIRNRRYEGVSGSRVHWVFIYKVLLRKSSSWQTWTDNNDQLLLTLQFVIAWVWLCCLKILINFDDLFVISEGFGFRHVQVILLFLCLTITYAERVNMSVAIVAMTDRNSTNPDFQEFDWGEREKSLVLSSFFWGYVITQIPGGQMAKKYGGKIMLLVSITLCSLLNLLTPKFAEFGDWPAVACLRVVQGLCQGVIFPSTHTLLAQWVSAMTHSRKCIVWSSVFQAPPCERGTIGTYCYSGAQFGTVVMLAVSGVLASSSMGWPSIFYLSGVAGLVWSILYFFYGASSPSDCPGRISSEERQFIESSLNTGEHGSGVGCVKIFPMPSGFN